MFLFSSFMFFFFICSVPNLLMVSLFFLIGVMSLAPSFDLGWRGFFLSWVYISGIFALIVYVSLFSSRKKKKSFLSVMFFFFVPGYIFFLPQGNILYSFYSNPNFFGFFLMLIFLISTLPLISYSFGPTVSCRSTLN